MATIMPIDHNAFRALTLEEQVYAVVTEGEYLARRYEEEDGINLYHMGTFFCKVYDYNLNKIVRTESSTESAGLEKLHALHQSY